MRAKECTTVNVYTKSKTQSGYRPKSLCVQFFTKPKNTQVK